MSFKLPTSLITLEEEINSKGQKMEQGISGRVTCAHCEGSGTCRTGKESESCFVCIKEAKARANTHGLVCSVCGGIGLTEFGTDKINRRITSVLAMLIAYFALVLVSILALTDNKHFSETLAFSG